MLTTLYKTSINKIGFVILCCSLNLFSQKSEIVLKSTNTHNYMIGYDYYIENAMDTARLLFMGTIKITSIHSDERIADAQRLLTTKAKELNGNAYILKTHTIQDSVIILYFDIYFASQKQVDVFKINSLKNKIIIFNNVKNEESRFIVINNTYSSFSQNKRIDILCPNKVVDLKLDTVASYNNGIKISFPKDKKAKFYTIKLKDNIAPIVVGSVLGGVVGAAIGSALVTKRKNNPQNEFFSTLNYNTAQILMAIYPSDKQIDLN